MGDQDVFDSQNPSRNGEIARDLRALANAGVEPHYAMKLLAAAAELEASVAGPSAGSLAKGD